MTGSELEQRQVDTVQMPVLARGSSPSSKARVLRAVTKCDSIDAFVTTFSPLVDEASVFVLAAEPLPVGAERHFVFQLADGRVALEGRGRVMEHRSDGGRLSTRRGMRLGFVELTPSSRAVHRLLVAAQMPAMFPHPNTVPREPARDVDDKPPLPVPPAGPWEQEPTRPGDPVEMAGLRNGELPPGPGEGRRRPGSPHTLPANPLADVTDDALADLVECTLHEEEGDVDPALALGVGGGWDGTTGARQPASPETRMQTERAITVRRRRIEARLAVVAAAAAALLGTAGGYALRGSSHGASAPDEVAVRSPAIVVDPAAAAEPAGDPGVAAPAIEMAEGGTAGESRCRARITTRPDGIQVRWGELELGSTPLSDVPVPCGPSNAVLDHARYQPVELSMVAEPGVPAVLDVTMGRPKGRLRLRSIPGGATFTVDGEAIPRGTRAVPVRSLTHVDVVATWPGYRAWSRRVYVRSDRTSVVAKRPAGRDTVSSRRTTRALAR